MKNFTSIIIAAFIVLSAAGCSGNTSSTGSSNSMAANEAASPAEIVTSAESGKTSETNSEPESSEPEGNTQEPDKSETSDSETIASETSESEVSVPETSAPETSAPETSAPETSAPETSAPETSAPTTTKPTTTKPTSTKPATTKPATTKPATTKPATTKTPEPEEPTEIKISDPSELINTVWALFSEDEKFPVVGGDFSSEEVVEGAAPFSLENPDELDRLTGFPASEIDKIDSAASMIHMMNTNTFSTGAFHIAEGTDAEALCQSIRDNVTSRRWMCGFPDKVIVAEVGDYIVCAFGLNETIDPFVKHLSEAYPFAEVVFDEIIL